MKYWYGSPDDPSNPQGGTDIDNDELENSEQLESDNKNNSRREDFGNGPTGHGDVCYSDADNGL